MIPVWYHVEDLFERSMDTNKSDNLGIHDGRLLIENGGLILKDVFSELKSALVSSRNTASIDHDLLKLNIKGQDA